MSGASSAPQTRVAPFDRSATFVPPDRLPIIDTYVKERAGTSVEAASDNLSTVTITPDGRVETTAPQSGDVEALLRSLKHIEITPRQLKGAMADSERQKLGSAEPSTGGDVLAESVIGQDTRTQITNTTSYPFRVMGRISLGCTGTLVGPRHVVTAGHCVYNIGNDQWYSNLDFSPGQNGNQRPYGTITWARAVTVKGWTSSHLRDYDYAMIVLSQDIGNSNGWLGYGWQEPMPAYNVNVNGYPGDKPFGTIWHSFCQLQIIQSFRLYYACDTFGGESGSAVYVYNTSDQSRTIRGIHAYGVDSTSLNGATRITESVFNKIKAWKKTY